MTTTTMFPSPRSPFASSLSRGRASRANDKKAALKVRGGGGFFGEESESSKSNAKKKKKKSRRYPFPEDYDEMAQQARQAVTRAIEDGIELGEIQFPPGGLDLAPGDLEGNVECTLTATVLRKILRGMKEERKINVLFPDPTELKLAKMPGFLFRK